MHTRAHLPTYPINTHRTALHCILSFSLFVWQPNRFDQLYPGFKFPAYFDGASTSRLTQFPWLIYKL